MPPACGVTRGYATCHPAAARRLCALMGFAVDGGLDDYREVGTHIPFVRFTPRGVNT
ncbi:hypothetical protein [Actinomadura sp. 3N407]|uniref:hypothetical protein n=1 Tax=Actinomadura sp. 3N407 TaxID=3457423 RepID=UPI003FCC82EB